MSDPRWRETRPSRPYGGEPGARPRGRVSGPPGTERAPAADGQGVPPGAGGVPRREAGRGTPGPRDAGPRGRDPGWDGRAASGRAGTGPNGRGGSARAAGDGPPTRRMPAQPDPPRRGTTPSRPTGARDGSARAASGPREARRRRNPRRSPGAGRWGALQGGLGVCIIVASAAVGTIATMVTRSAPGFLLGLFVEAGTVVAAVAVRPRAGRMIFPAPVLSYLVGALISGFVFNRSGTSKTALAIGAAQWVANGFFAMALATVLAIAIITVRWYFWRRSRRPARPVRRSRMDWEARDSWDDADPRGGARRPGPRPGTGPYNFSRGA